VEKKSSKERQKTWWQALNRPNFAPVRVYDDLSLKMKRVLMMSFPVA
jgi:hypothetical protein